MLSLFRKSAPPSTNSVAAGLIEVIYAAKDMAAHLVIADGRDFECICGPITAPYEDPTHHHDFCPVARFFSAVDAIVAEHLPADCAGVESDCESLRNGTARYSTPREDAALLAIICAFAAVLIWGVVYFAQKAGLLW